MHSPILEQIDHVVKENDIVLFMKGTPEFPQCGFSQQVAAILNSYQAHFAAVNVLLNEEIRQGIKDYANWPTIPQLYIGGEFIGGCDIVKDMHAEGELAEIIRPFQVTSNV